jgi:hypothetical protein
MPKPSKKLTGARRNQLLKQAVDAIRSQHSIYWIGDDVELLAAKVAEGSPDYLDRLRKIQRGVGNLVRNVTGKAVPVIYSSGQQSYTDGTKVVLSAEQDPTKLDAMCGVACHEGSHIVWSNEYLNFLRKDSVGKFDDLVKNSKLPQLALKFNLAAGKMEAAVHMVMNILEDRRIDLLQYRNAPGYQPYYESMYNTYFNSPTIDAALTSDPMEPSVENYEMHIINLTNPNWNADALPGLRELRKVVNLTEDGIMSRGDEDPKWKSWQKNVMGYKGYQLANLPLLFADSVRIVEIMYENAQYMENKNAPQQTEPSDEDAMGGEEDLPNMDMPSMDELKEALENQKKFLKGEAVEKKNLPAAIQEQLETMEKSKAQIKDVHGDFLPKNVKARVIIYRDLTKEIVKTPSFPFGNHGRLNVGMQDALENGIRMGQILANKLRVMADEKPLTFNHQKHGRLDKRRVASLGTGAIDPFAITMIERMKPANVWLDLDFSGSMQGEPAQKAIQLAVAIAFAAEKTRTLNCVIAVRDGGNNAARVAILYDSRRHRFSQLRDIVPWIDTGGGTPESLCFEAVKDEMMKTWRDERKYFINFSDGAPGHSFTDYKTNQRYSYGGEEAYRHCRSLMTEFRNVGIKILSYFLGDQYYAGPFKQMYGLDARFIDTDSITAVAGTLNKLLLGREE